MFTFKGKTSLKDLFKHISVLATFNSYSNYLSILLYRMRNNFKLRSDQTNNGVEYLVMLVIVIHFISSNYFEIDCMPLTAITSMLLINFSSICGLLLARNCPMYNAGLSAYFEK